MVARRLRSLLHSDTNRSEIAGKFLEKLMMYAFKLTCLGQFNRDACFWIGCEIIVAFQCLLCFYDFLMLNRSMLTPTYTQLTFKINYMTQRCLHGLAATCPLIRINMNASRDLWFSLPVFFQKVIGSVIAFRMPTHWDVVHRWVTRYSIIYLAFKQHLKWEYFDLFNSNFLE